MTVLSDLKLSQKPSNDELVAKFNIVSDRTIINSNRIEKAIITKEDFYIKFEKRMNKIENNISEKINNLGSKFEKRIGEIEKKDEIDDIKEKSSIMGIIKVSGRNALLKIFEYGIVVLFYLGVSMIIKK